MRELAWSKFKAEKLMKAPDCKPEDTWFRMSCKLKRNLYSIMTLLERILQQEETTDQDDERPTLTLGRGAGRTKCPKFSESNKTLIDDKI